MLETWVQSLGQEDPLEKEMAKCSSTLAWKIPWTEKPCRQQSMGSQRVGHDWVTLLIYLLYTSERAPLVAQRLKSLPAMRETWVRSLGQEDPLEKKMATHSSILAWRIPWMEESGGLPSTESQSRAWLSDLTNYTSETILIKATNDFLIAESKIISYVSLNLPQAFDTDCHSVLEILSSFDFWDAHLPIFPFTFLVMSLPSPSVQLLHVEMCRSHSLNFSLFDSFSPTSQGISYCFVSRYIFTIYLHAYQCLCLSLSVYPISELKNPNISHTQCLLEIAQECLMGTTT